MPLDYAVYATDPDPVWDAAWRDTERLIEDTRRVAEASGARYALVSASTPPAARPRRQLPRDARADLGSRWAGSAVGGARPSFGHPFLSLEPELRRETQHGQILHWRYDGHWNAAGNAFAAKWIAEFVLNLDREPPGNGGDLNPESRTP